MDGFLIVFYKKFSFYHQTTKLCQSLMFQQNRNSLYSTLQTEIIVSNLLYICYQKTMRYNYQLCLFLQKFERRTEIFLCKSIIAHRSVDLE